METETLLRHDFNGLNAKTVKVLFVTFVSSIKIALNSVLVSNHLKTHEFKGELVTKSTLIER